MLVRSRFGSSIARSAPQVLMQSRSCTLSQHAEQPPAQHAVQPPAQHAVQPPANEAADSVDLCMSLRCFEAPGWRGIWTQEN